MYSLKNLKLLLNGLGDFNPSLPFRKLTTQSHSRNQQVPFKDFVVKGEFLKGPKKLGKCDFFIKPPSLQMCLKWNLSNKISDQFDNFKFYKSGNLTPLSSILKDTSRSSYIINTKNQATFNFLSKNKRNSSFKSLLYEGNLFSKKSNFSRNHEKHTKFSISSSIPSKPSKLRLCTVGSCFPKYKLVVPSYIGEDCHFYTFNQQTDIIGVADGVGGWKDYNINPSIYPTVLMDNCKKLIMNGKFNPQDPQDLLNSAYVKIENCKDEKVVGSCTACLVMFNDGTLHAVNVGDTGYLLVREGQVIKRSCEQIYRFNTPYQLSKPPGGRKNVINNSPLDADIYATDVKINDLIIIGTDGLFDNMFDKDIVKNLSSLNSAKISTKSILIEQMQTTVTEILSKAHKNSFDPEWMSPFAKQAQQNGLFFKGGKPDDITVVLSKVVSS